MQQTDLGRVMPLLVTYAATLPSEAVPVINVSTAVIASVAVKKSIERLLLFQALVKTGAFSVVELRFFKLLLGICT